MRGKVYEEEQIRFDKPKMCFSKVNDRDVCYELFDGSSQDVLWIVYNPGVQNIDITSIIIKTA